jgi:predicted NUDIX family NTP pyrophosphohydrolase
MSFPEIDRAEFFDLETAKRRINRAQVPLLEAVETVVRSRGRYGAQ